MKLMKGCVKIAVLYILICASVSASVFAIMDCTYYTVNCSLVDPYTFRLYALIASVVECAVLCREVCNVFSSVQRLQCSLTLQCIVTLSETL